VPVDIGPPVVLAPVTALVPGIAPLVSLEQTKLDEHYVLAKTVWRLRFEPAGRAPTDVTVPSTYVVRTSDAAPVIVFYLNHADIMAVLREYGLLPAGMP